MSKVHVINGDCLSILKSCPDNYFDSIVTDPPYGISFMGKKWDYDVPKVVIWKEVLRVLKPGGHIVVACGTKTQHRMAVNIEDAGFEIRDIVSWVYGSGFPKSLDISKAIDKMKGAENDEAKQYDGWGTALKPAQELFTLARKPLSEKTVAANVLKWGTGGLNIDDSRVGTGTGKMKTVKYPDIKGDNFKQGKESYQDREKVERTIVDKGRFPANFIHDGSKEVLDKFPTTKSGKDNKRKKNHQTNAMSGTLNTLDREEVSYGDSGSAARFFYCAKTSKSERGEGNDHPTVKPIKLMEYLIRLITPFGGKICDPYAGSGSTGVAAKNINFDCVLVEREKEYCEIIKNRLKNYETN